MVILGTKQNGFVFDLGEWFIWNWHKYRIGRRYITRGIFRFRIRLFFTLRTISIRIYWSRVWCLLGNGNCLNRWCLFDRRLITVGFYRIFADCRVRSWYWKTPLVISLFSGLSDESWLIPSASRLVRFRMCSGAQR